MKKNVLERIVRDQLKKKPVMSLTEKPQVDRTISANVVMGPNLLKAHSCISGFVTNSPKTAKSIALFTIVNFSDIPLYSILRRNHENNQKFYSEIEKKFY